MASLPPYLCLTIYFTLANPLELSPPPKSRKHMEASRESKLGREYSHSQVEWPARSLSRAPPYQRYLGRGSGYAETENRAALEMPNNNVRLHGRIFEKEFERSSSSTRNPCESSLYDYVPLGIQEEPRSSDESSILNLEQI